MAEINIPGDELEEVSRALAFVLEHIDISSARVDLGRAVGPGLIDQAENFENRWGDGRFQLRREAEEIRSQIDQILETFKQADDAAGASLEGR
ncbi:hypothetical protein ACI2LC_11830 [Nonomuraea wenchangensis]|uniref:hypothetical protein n=1 Tax=Nonomuraea wenchangensis TaxID=568860 RepID=UPI0033D27B85